MICHLFRCACRWEWSLCCGFPPRSVDGPGGCASLVWVSCFFVLWMWMGEMFLLALLFLWVEIRLQSKLLDEDVCACELAVHFGWRSARPPLPTTARQRAACMCQPAFRRRPQKSRGLQQTRCHVQFDFHVPRVSQWIAFRWAARGPSCGSPRRGVR